MTFLLRTSLAKAGKENQGATPITLELAKDTTRIKKHISSVIDRVSKGSRISDEKNKLEAPSLVDFKIDLDDDDNSEDTVNENPDAKKVANNNDKNADVNQTPIGTQFGERGERLRSARVRSAINPNAGKKIDIQEDSSEIGLIVENGPVDNAGKSKTQPNEDEIEAEKHIINDDDDDEDGDENDIW